LFGRPLVEENASRKASSSRRGRTRSRKGAAHDFLSLVAFSDPLIGMDWTFYEGVKFEAPDCLSRKEQIALLDTQTSSSDTHHGGLKPR